MSSIVTCNKNENGHELSETKTCKIITGVIDEVFEIKIETKDNKDQYTTHIIHISGEELKSMIEMTSFMAMNFLEKEINDRGSIF